MILTKTTIRRATAADAEALAAVGRESFIAAFGPLYSPRDLAAFLDDQHVPQRYAAFAEDPRLALWLLEADRGAVGYALAGPCHLPHAEVTPNCGELKRIYLLPAAQGLGQGARLLETALDWLRRPGRSLWLGVYSENHRAQRLYARHGFERVGDYKFPVGRQLDLEFILRRPG